MKYVKFLVIPLLFVALAFMNIGGCGGSSGGNFQPTNPPPTQPPPTQPPSQCQVPALDTDFSDLLFLFIDAPNNILIGVTSLGTDVIIVLADIVIDECIASRL